MEDTGLLDLNTQEKVEISGVWNKQENNKSITEIFIGQNGEVRRQEVLIWRR